MVMMDPPDHTAFRRLVARGFTPRQVAVDRTRGPGVRRRAARSTCGEAGSGDVVAELFKPLPSMVVAHYLGVPVEDRARFDGWTDAIVAANAARRPAGRRRRRRRAVRLLRRADRAAPRRPRRRHHLALVAARPRIADPADLALVIGFAFTMVTGGNDTTTGLARRGGAAADGAPRPAPAPDRRPELIGRAVDELLRLTSPVQGLARTTTRDVELSTASRSRPVAR